VKVSVICTLKNEESSVRNLIESLLSQSRKPNEIVIVDGGSTDHIIENVNSYVRRDVTPVTLIVREGVNIVEGRNIAIRNARYNYIASIDGGCRADKHWLQNLLKPFEEDPSTDVVAGFFLPDPRSKYEEVVGELLYPKLERMSVERFLPSGRSIAFKKKCWREVSGYPEWLYTGEDTLFDLKLRERGYNFTFAKDAIVYWRPRDSLYGLFKQYFLYARGGVEAGITSMVAFEAYGKNVIGYLLFYSSRYYLSLIKEKKFYI